MDYRRTNIKKNNQKECVWFKATKGVQYLAGLKKKATNLHSLDLVV